MTVNFEAVLGAFTAAIEAGDGKALAGLFTPEGVYHDGFYGANVGRDAIARMLEEEFWGHAEGFRWRMFDPVCDGRIGYARYFFSYDSKLSGVEGRTVRFDGMSQFNFEGELIACYREQFNTGMAMVQLDFAPDRIANHLRKRAAALKKPVP
ncbi:MAG: nuclear transport factor 2 family protein [Pseudomonadales bacterium]|nr:nuclear transport factor 2 family protein [Pseudomonadales bacterium]